MGRWEPDARGRLTQAAFELFSERGFGDTTVADIATRAGLTKRTFFRHFEDKREVIFSGQDEMGRAYTEAIAAAPAQATPIAAVTLGLEAAGHLVERNGALARERAAIVRANPELVERESRKREALAGQIAAALEARGVDGLTAVVTSELAVAVFKIAYARWSARKRTSMKTELHRVLAALPVG